MTTVELRTPATAGEIRDQLRQAEDAADKEGPPRARPERRPRTPVNFGLGLALRASLTLSALVLGFVIYLLLLAPIQQDRAQTELYAQLRESLALGTTPIQGLIEPGTPIAVLKIDGLGLEQVVVEGTASGDLQVGPGHRRNTALPGQQGVSLLYGRSATFGSPFGTITTLRSGDPVSVTTGQGSFRYEVQGVRRNGDPLPPVLAAGASRLTLVTSTNSAGSSALVADSTVYVDAILVDGDAQPGGQRPAIIPSYEQAMRGDTGALVPLVLWLQLLVAVAAVSTWARSRWGRWQTWVGAVPLVVLATWQVFGAAARLLPNLL